MRSFLLQDLVSVEKKDYSSVIDEVAVEENKGESDEQESLMSKEELIELYGAQDQDQSWRYKFLLTFKDISFIFIAKSVKEQNEWVKLLNLFVDMNSEGINCLLMNPYAFLLKTMKK